MIMKDSVGHCNKWARQLQEVTVTGNQFVITRYKEAKVCPIFANIILQGSCYWKTVNTLISQND